MARWGKWFGFAKDEVFDEGLAAYDRGDFEKAVEAFDRCLGESSDQNELRLARFYMAQALSELGNDCLRESKPETALNYFEQALKLYPNYPDLNLAAAKAGRLLERHDLQDRYADRALESNPKFVDAIVFKGLTLYEHGHHEDGLKKLEHACQVDPHLNPDRFRRAIDLHEEGDVDGAARHLCALALSSSADAQLHLRLGDSFMREKRYREAAQEYQEAIQLKSDLPDAHCRLGKALLAIEAHHQAVCHLEECLSLNPGHADAHAQLGVAYRAMERLNDAKSEFEKALSLNPDHPVALKFSGGYLA